MDGAEVNSIADLARASLTLAIEGTPVAIVPTGYEFEVLERLLPTPRRRAGLIDYGDAGSFIRAVKAAGAVANPETPPQDVDDGMRLYGVRARGVFRAVFNDHHGAAPGWRDHVAVYSCPRSVEWETWTKANGKRMSQADFAQFIEDNAPDCVNPTAADMIEIARSLEAKKGVNFASSIRLADGQTQLTYEETISGTAAKGRLAIPERFSIGISVFEGGARYAVFARLRFRIEGAALKLWYDLDRPHKVVEDAVSEVWQQIEQATGRQIFALAP